MINVAQLNETARQLMAPGKGLLAMDESTPTCNKRFAERGIPQTEEMRRVYRELIVTTKGLGEAISGAILYDETVHQKTSDGTAMVQALESAGIIPGIKVDEGAKDLAAFPGEKVTEGLDGLREHLADYASQGLKFAKWRAVIAIGEGTPTRSGISANVHALARYAALCQEAGIVPIVEPEVLMEGDHTLQQCGFATLEVLHQLFDQLYEQRVHLSGLLLKPNMVLPGLDCKTQEDVDTVAKATIGCLLAAVPAIVPGVAFLSGGQPYKLATARLNAMNHEYGRRLPWALTFSFSRAIQQPALDIWKGQAENTAAAQAELLRRASLNGDARKGIYDAATDPDNG